MFGCFSSKKTTQSDRPLPSDLQLQLSIREKKYSSRSLIKEEENQKMEIKINKDNLDNYKKSLDELANINRKTKNRDASLQIIKKTLITENSSLYNHSIHISSMITGLKHKLYDYEVKLDEKISEDNDKSLADDHIFFLKNVFMSKESKILNLTNLIDGFKKKSKPYFEFEVKEKDEYYFNEILKYEREKMNVVSKHLNNENVKREKLSNDASNLKAQIEFIKKQSEKKPALESKPSGDINSKSSNLPTSFGTSKGVPSKSPPNKYLIEQGRNDKLQEVEKLKAKLRKKAEMIDILEKDIHLEKREFSKLKEELFSKTNELSSRFNKIYKLEMKIGKLNIKPKKQSLEGESPEGQNMEEISKNLD